SYNGNLIYGYSPVVKPLNPFNKIKPKSKRLDIIKKVGINYLPSNLSFGTSISRYYYEQQLRSVDDSGITLPLSVSKSFLWDRQFSIQWNLLQSLSMNLSTATDARIEEPSGAVNKRLFAEEYTLWKDSIKNSFRHFGTPWDYQQSFNATLNVPLNNIAALNWMTLTSSYNATYNWDRGAIIDDTTSVGNSISNQGRLSVNSKFNFENLYNKSKFLKSVNQKFNDKSNNNKTQKKRERFQRSVTLRTDTSTLLKHNLGSKRPIVSATVKGEAYPITYKVVDANTIRIENRDDKRIIVTVLPGKRPEENKWYKMGVYTARFAMMLRSVNVQFTNTRSMTLPSFEPSIGDIFGQSRNYGSLSPGLGFAFATVGTRYIQDAVKNGWLMTQDSSLTSPAIYNRTNDLQADIVLEPFRGLKITLNVARSHSRNNQIYFMYDNTPTIQGGSFTMTHIAIATTLRKLSSDNGYQSDAFDVFLQNRQIIADRLESLYQNTCYPSASFITDASLVGTPYNSENGGINTSSADVMIPAFLAAYTGQDADKIDLTAFPSWGKLIPNWKITYDGLTKLEKMGKYFKSFVISHAYKCTYNVNSFSSYLNWVSVGGDMGYTKDSQTGNPIPSSPYDISSVSLIESFSPLLGVDFTMKNNVSGSVAYKNSRNLNLSISSVQIVEAITQDISVGAGYKFTDLKGFYSGRGGKQGTFSNDLTLRGDFSFSRTHSLIRRIEQGYTQATSGNKAISMKYSAEYKLSRYITLQAYYDLQITTPLISSSSYPTLNSDIGVTIKLDLAR
ncbi:MAG: cell surface protein SprA, partial [Porphyromonadaceae bacterium]|nr:cell surface protein SprA [Porphyromonadaceae bacterium]